MSAWSAITNFIARYGPIAGLLALGFSGVGLLYALPHLPKDSMYTNSINQIASLLIWLSPSAILMAIFLVASHFFPSFEDLKSQYKSRRALRRCQKQFRSLSPLEKAIVAIQLSNHSNTFFYPKYAEEVQKLTDMQWVSGDAYGGTESCRYQFDWGVWGVLEKFRGEIRNQVLSDTYRDAVEKVAKKINRADEARR